MRLYFAILLASLALWSMSCSTSDFTSNTSPGNGDGKKGVDADGGDGDSDGKDDDGSDVDGPGGADDTDGGDDGRNPDGSVTERFTGALTKLEGGSDIVFAVDTSGSMNAEKTRLQQHMAAFLSKFSQESAKLDYQVYLIGDRFQFPQDLGDRFIEVQQRVSSNDSLDILQKFFSGSYTLKKPLREDSKKQIVVVTDDNARRVTADTFKQFVNNTPMLKGKTAFNGFVILQNSALSSWCTRAALGNEYVKLANDPDTKGTIYDLCTTDWNALLKTLAEKILQEVPRERFALAAVPENPDAIEVTVDGAAVSHPDWTYDDDANAVVFTKDTAPAKGSKVAVTFFPQ